MDTQTFPINEDIRVICVTAESFPQGIGAAYDKLNALNLPSREKRHMFGISRPNGNDVVYKACMTELEEGEASKLGLESFTIKKGNYVGVVVKDFMNNIPLIGQIFQELIQRHDIDPNGYCLEWYQSPEEVRCVVPVKGL
jgi:predicted transcriptional regulator YdeE